MADDRIECVPSLATPKPLPRPEPLQKSVYNLDLTPEKRPKVSRNVKARSELSVPTLNSTAKIQLQIEKLKCKKKTTVSQTTSLISDPTIAQYSKSNVLKVTSDSLLCHGMCHYKFLVQAVNIPFNTRVYSDLVSVEVPPSGTADKHTIQLPHWQHKSTKPVAEPNIADLYPLTSYVCVVGTPRLHI